MNRLPSDQLLTVGEALRLGVERLGRAGVEQPQLDMSLLLGEVTGLDRLHVYTGTDRPLTPPERERLRELLARRVKREPLAYILGRREFYGLTLTVTPAVLIPRPETELLVEEALRWLQARPEGEEPLCAEIGTGSGAIPIALAHASPRGRWFATDISAEALQVARQNAERHGVAERIEFLQGHLLDPIPGPLDLLIANLPYVPEPDRLALAPEVAQYEPAGALFAGPAGLDLIRPFIAQAVPRLRPGGLLLIECDPAQTAPIRELLRTANPAFELSIICDYAGLERHVRAGLPA